MSSLVDNRKTAAVELILAILRERVSRCADGLQISSRTMQRALREKFGRAGLLLYDCLQLLLSNGNFICLR